MVIECVGRCPTPRQGEVLPAPPARLRRANKHNEMTSTPQQEIQEMQEMQERPVGATEGTRGCGAEPRQEHQSANQRISQSARRSMERPEMQERPASGRRMKTLEDRQGAKRRAAGAVSGGAAERPTEPEAVRAPSCVFAVKPLRSLGGYAAPPTYPKFQQSYKQWLIKLSVIGTVINAFYRIIDKVINSG